MFQQNPVPRPKKEVKKKCKIVIKKKGDRIEKSIEGECTANEIKALSQQEE